MDERKYIPRGRNMREHIRKNTSNQAPNYATCAYNSYKYTRRAQTQIIKHMAEVIFNVCQEGLHAVGRLVRSSLLLSLNGALNNSGYRGLNLKLKWSRKEFLYSKREERINTKTGRGENMPLQMWASLSDKKWSERLVQRTATLFFPTDDWTSVLAPLVR